MAAFLSAMDSSQIIYVLIFLVVIGFKVISAIIKASKEASDNAKREGGSNSDVDLWQPKPRAARRSAAPVPPPIPSAQRRPKSARSTMQPPPVVEAAGAPEGVSEEAAHSVIALESSADRFETRQDHAYDLEFSDIPESSDDAFSLTRRSRKSRGKHVRINLRGKQLRNAVIAREILAPPRCFDI